MNHVRRAAYLNSNGATSLAHGDNKEAYQSFKGALKSLLQAVTELGETAPPNKSQTTAAASNPLRMDAISRAVPRSRMDGKDAQLSLLAKDGNPYVYGKGLVFYPSATFTMVELTFYSAVVVFNLVLTYHRGTKNLQERDLNKLLVLYDLVLKLIGEAARSGQYDCGNIVVAALNNKAVVHAGLGQHAQARRMLYPVYDVMKRPERRPRLMETWEVEGIFLNIHLMLVNGPGVAEAA